jgi:putative ABC transport system substrate-binding protein
MRMQMNRRTFLGALASGLLAAPVTAQTRQATKVWRIGLFIPGSPPACGSVRPPPAQTALRQGLQDLGYVESQDYVLVVRCVLHNTQVASAAQELVASDLDAIIVASNELARAVKKATATVPVVFFALTDPERQGLVASLVRPGGNMTGFSHMTAELAGKRLELLRDTLPRVRKVAILSVDRHPYIATEASRLGMGARVFLAKPNALEATFGDIAKAGTDGVLVDAHPLFWVERELIVKYVARLKLPAIYENRDFVVAGGLLAYGASLADMSRRSAAYVDRI